MGPFLTVIGSNGTGGGTQRPAGDLKQHNSQRQGEVDDEESVRVFERRASCVRPPQVIHGNRLLVRSQRGCHGRAPGDRWQDPVWPHQGPEHRLYRGIEEKAIIDALNALRHRCTYVFTSGGIGPTHGDITADCVAKAFGVPIDRDPRALAILHEWVKTTGAKMNEARLRMTRIPKGVDLILNKVSGAWLLDR